MAASLPLLKKTEYGTGSWANESSDFFVNYEAAESLYERLIEQSDLGTTVDPSFFGKPSQRPEYEQNETNDDEKEYHLDSLLTDQREWCRWALSSTPFSWNFHKRLTLVRKILAAIARKRPKREKATARAPNRRPMPRSSIADAKNPAKTAKTASEQLVELGVHTGLSLLFSLLKQTWSRRETSGALLCDSVLETASAVLGSLPPNSLSSKSKLPELGVLSLEKVTGFLTEMVGPESPADGRGQQLALELLLQMALQRGSLCFFLNWIELALKCKADGDVISGKLLRDVIGGISKLDVRNHVLINQ